MDRIIVKEKSKLKPFLIAVAILFVAYAIYNLLFLNLSAHSIDKSQVRIGTVKRGPLDMLVVGSGVVAAKDPEWIVSKVSGQVIEAKFKAGDSIKKGDVLVSIINEDISSAYTKSESELSAIKSDFSALKANLGSIRINYESELKKAELDAKQADLYYNAVKNLWETGTPPISQIEYVNTSIRAEQMHALSDAARKKLNSFKENETAQLNAFKFRLASKEAENSALKSKENNLRITANGDGILQDFNLKVGQGVAAGDVIAQIIDPTNTYVTLSMPATQAFKLATMQKVDIEINRRIVHGGVHRIDPNVKGTTVEVDVFFDQNVSDAKIGMFVNGTIYTKKIPDALYVDIPSHVAENASMSVFVLSPDGKFANLAKIESGTLSATYLEIIDGLKEGDKIILSDFPLSEGLDQLQLN